MPRGALRRSNSRWRLIAFAVPLFVLFGVVLGAWHLLEAAHSPNVLHSSGCDTQLKDGLTTESLARRAAVVRTFQHAWGGYKAFAWGKDELLPLSKRGTERFKLGGTIADVLDVMHLMGLQEDLSQARAWVTTLDVNANVDVSLFETTIRILGGFLSAYQLTNDELYKQKALEVAERLVPAFRTTSGLPYPTVNLQSGQGRSDARLSLSEPTSLQLEFRVAARLANKPSLREGADLVMDKVRDMPKKDGLLPLTGLDGGLRGRFGLGARGDSYYEYLLKQWLLSNKTEERYLKAYQDTVAGIKKHLIRRTSHNGVAFVAEADGFGDKEDMVLVTKMDHLVCFFPGLLALGWLHGAGPREDLDLAEELVEGCWMMYNTTKTGIAPEITQFDMSKGAERDVWIKPADHFSRLRPETVESLFYLYRITRKEKYRDWGWAIHQAIEKHARVITGGYAVIKNVDETPVVLEDKMETFFLAETLKYMYLLFSEHDLIPLDQFVFNTEAHPFRIF